MNICAVRTLTVAFEEDKQWFYIASELALPHEPKSEHRFAMYQISGPEIQIDESPNRGAIVNICKLLTRICEILCCGIGLNGMMQLSAVCKHCGLIYEFGGEGNREHLQRV